jgi:D-alanyl-D-alanine dipeptidase
VAHADGQELDMGTPFDFFSPRSWPSAPNISPTAKENRALLAAAMRRRGFRPYVKEWWHFTLAHEPFPATYFDFPVK